MKKNEKAYQQVIRLMQNDISDGDLTPDHKFLTDKEASERYGFSRITIRRAFMELEKEGILYRVQGKGTFIGKNKLKELKMVAFMGSCLVQNTVEPLFIRGIEDYLVKHDFNLIVCNDDNNVQRSWNYIIRMSEYGIEGMILVPLLALDDINIKMIEYVLSKNIPVIIIDRHVPGLENVVSTVEPDNYTGGRLVTEHLISLGHTRIGFFCDDIGNVSSSAQDRLNGYKDALRDAGIEPDPRINYFADLSSLPSLIKRWFSMPDSPTAIFCENDLNAVRMIELLQMEGKRIPEDISIVGFDDILNLLTPVPMTTIHVDHREEGRVAASHLIDMINGVAVEPHRIVLPVDLVIRQSTGINPQLVKHIPKNNFTSLKSSSLVNE